MQNKNLSKLTKDIITYNKKITALKNEIKKVVVGQEEVMDATIKCVICDGHALLEGVPGVAKTLLLRTLSIAVSDIKYQRIQFTPDLLPADIIGITAYNPDKGFYIVKGPIFANFVLADEINRAPPKVQSAMLEAMCERMVTIGREEFVLKRPFLVLATQNPLEQMGVYPLPEAQIDRFLFKVFVDYPKKDEEIHVLDQNIELKNLEDYGVQQVVSPQELIKMHELVKEIHISPKIKEYIVDLVSTTRGKNDYKIESIKYVAHGGSPRASIYLQLASKATAFLNNRAYVVPDDVKDVAHGVLRHRLSLNYEGKARGIQTDEIIDDLLKVVPVP